jgi:hypothetical protein
VWVIWFTALTSVIAVMVLQTSATLICERVVCVLLIKMSLEATQAAQTTFVPSDQFVYRYSMNNSNECLIAASCATPSPLPTPLLP